MTTTVVNRRRSKFDVYIGRGSPWGNPYRIPEDGNRHEVIEKYREYLLASQPLLDQIGRLRGQRLGCYCAPLACHGDILAELADA